MCTKNIDNYVVIDLLDLATTVINRSIMKEFV